MKKQLSHAEAALANQLFYQPALQIFCPVQKDLWSDRWLMELQDKGYLVFNKILQLKGPEGYEFNLRIWDITDKAKKELMDAPRKPNQSSKARKKSARNKRSGRSRRKPSRRGGPLKPDRYSG